MNRFTLALGLLVVAGADCSKGAPEDRDAAVSLDLPADKGTLDRAMDALAVQTDVQADIQAHTQVDTQADTQPDLATDIPADATPVPDAAVDASPDGPDGGPGQGNCSATPSPRNVAIPLFDRIFTGSHRVTFHFDHDEPKEFSDRNGFQVDWCGRRRTREIDGHSGYDFTMPEGTPLLAPADGVVNWAGFDIRFFCPLKNREVTDQLRVEITHRLPDGRRVTSNYKHLSRVDVQRGQRVTAGTPIGLSGNSGCSTGPHLHFENWLMDGTRTGRSVLIDAFGWDGEGPDPWAGKPDGAPSMWLWKTGQAPNIFTP